MINFGNYRPKFALSHVVAAGLVFLVFVIMSLVGWRLAGDAARREQQHLTDTAAVNASRSVRQELDRYIALLRGGAVLVEMTDQLRTEQWNQYVNSFHLASDYPDLQLVGYSPVVRADSLSEFEAMQREQGRPGYHIHPVAAKDEYAAVQFASGHSGQLYEGYDLLSETSSRQAMTQAGDSAQVQISGRLVLYEDRSANKDVPGVMIFLPIYNDGMAVNSIADRRAAVRGYLFVGFHAHSLLEKASKSIGSNFGLRLYASANTSQFQIMYESPSDAAIRLQHGVIGQSTINGLSAGWRIEASSLSVIVSGSVRSRPSYVLVVGLLVGGLFAFYALILLTWRSRRQYYEEQREVQQAKDELLALASHQLRTPATGVKQYVGMLLEGYGGKLDSKVLDMLRRAYVSNERQLEIISDILHVARIDAGRLELTLKVVDVAQLLRQVLFDHQLTFDKRHQTVESQIASRTVNIMADETYLRMALENIINNASKYTMPGGRIVVRLRDLSNLVAIQIKDSGVGIHKDDLPRLFKKFSRIANVLSSEVGGSGIGLYLAQKIIHLHDGQIRVNSMPGKGSTFTVNLPKNINQNK